MSEVLTPVDEIGMPLPLAPTNLDEYDAGQQPPDWHHHFHPRRSPLLTESLGGQAVRNARVQKADYRIHHNDYHGYYAGPQLPETTEAQFGVAILAAAGYVPAEAIEFSSAGPQIITLRAAQRNRLWRSGELKPSSTKIVRDFLIEYTLGQDLSGVDEKLIDEFLFTKNKQKRYQLGGVLLNFAIERAVEPLDHFYRVAWKKGYINRTSAQRPHRMLKTKLNLKKQQPVLVSRLYDELAA